MLRHTAIALVAIPLLHVILQCLLSAIMSILVIVVALHLLFLMTRRLPSPSHVPLFDLLPLCLSSLLSFYCNVHC